MRICVFLGASPGRLPLYARAAEGFGRLLAERGHGLVYGGGNVGLMGVIADAALAAGGEVIGVIPEALRDRELDHRGLSELHVVDTMHARKAMMADLSDAFVALPGGIGTLEELFEVWTWAQLGYHDKPCGLLNVGGFYDAMAGFLDLVVAEGFLSAAHRARLIVGDEPTALLDRIRDYDAPPALRWIDRSDA